MHIYSHYPLKQLEELFCSLLMKTDLTRITPVSRMSLTKYEVAHTQIHLSSITLGGNQCPFNMKLKK